MLCGNATENLPLKAALNDPLPVNAQVYGYTECPRFHFLWCPWADLLSFYKQCLFQFSRHPLIHCVTCCMCRRRRGSALGSILGCYAPISTLEGRITSKLAEMGNHVQWCAEGKVDFNLKLSDPNFKAHIFDSLQGIKFSHDPIAFVKTIITAEGLFTIPDMNKSITFKWMRQVTQTTVQWDCAELSKG